MNYLYELMGIAMITGIMSMLEIGVSMSRQGLKSVAPLDPYFTDSNARNVEKAFLEVLTFQANSTWPKGQEFCNQLKIQANNISPLVSNYAVQQRSISSHPKLSSSCSLVSPKHRVVISYSNPTANTYGLYSCVNSLADACKFEY